MSKSIKPSKVLYQNSKQAASRRKKRKRVHVEEDKKKQLHKKSLQTPKLIPLNLSMSMILKCVINLTLCFILSFYSTFRMLITCMAMWKKTRRRESSNSHSLPRKESMNFFSLTSTYKLGKKRKVFLSHSTSGRSLVYISTRIEHATISNVNAHVLQT